MARRAGLRWTRREATLGLAALLLGSRAAGDTLPRALVAHARTG